MLTKTHHHPMLKGKYDIVVTTMIIQVAIFLIFMTVYHAYSALGMKEQSVYN